MFFFTNSSLSFFLHEYVVRQVEVVINLPTYSMMFFSAFETMGRRGRRRDQDEAGGAGLL